MSEEAQPQGVELPERLFRLLQQGTPAVLATYGADEWPNVVMTWVAAPDPHSLRFGVDLGSSTLKNIERTGKVTIQVIGPEDVLYLVKGVAHLVKARIEALPPPHLMCIMGLVPVQVKDQSWTGVVVSPLQYDWVGKDAERLAAATRAALEEIRDWTPGRAPRE